MHLTGNLINAYFICQRKLWLYARQLSPDPAWELLELGRLLTQASYPRDKKEITTEGMKIDLIKREDGDFILGEIKKSSKGIKAAMMQLAFYLYKLKKEGLELKGELLIPKQRKRIPVKLDNSIETQLNHAISEIRKIISYEKPPAPSKTGYCRHCAYSEFCWA